MARAFVSFSLFLTLTSTLAGTVVPALAQAPLPDVPLLPGESAPGAASASQNGSSPPEPVTALPPNREPETSAPFRFSLNTIISQTDRRTPVVRPTSEAAPTWASRLDLRVIGHPALTERVGLLANLRLRSAVAEGETWQFEKNSHLDVQELAVDTKATEWLTLEAGRINVRNGVATGFNPTDWFKNDSLIVADSYDVVDRREDRLGTLVTQATLHQDSVIATMGFRPDVERRTDAWTSDQDFVGQGLNRTNSDSGAYLKVSPLFSDNTSIALNAYWQPNEPGAGAEVSRAVSDTVVLFGEWFGQRRYSLVDESRRTARLSDTVAESLGAENERRWYHQAALGATWSLPFDMVGPEDISITAEYHFNQAGLTGSQMKAWFDAGTSGAAASGPLWAIRGTASRRQEPLARHQTFVRFKWGDIVKDVDVGLIAFAVPEDRSALVQGDIDYMASPNLKLGLSAYAATGSDRSIYGSQTAPSGFRFKGAYSF